MAQINLGQSTAPEEQEASAIPAPEETLRSDYVSEGYSDLQSDPNDIQVTISDQTTPIILLFGPPSSGKTMMLLRLARYLHAQGYKVAPIKDFRGSGDSYYRQLYEQFNAMVASPDAAPSTDAISFMLLGISSGEGQTICQILEAPGEHYFNPNSPADPFPRYIQRILSIPNRKLVLFLTEPIWEDRLLVNEYVQRVDALKRVLRSRDRFVVVLNKVDKAEEIFRTGGEVNEDEAFRKVGQWYPGLFEKFRNEHPITSLWRKYDVDFAVFQSGYFITTTRGTQAYEPSPDKYVSDLWNLILKKIRG